MTQATLDTPPIIIKLADVAFHTDMYSASTILLGDDPVGAISPENQGPPMISLARCEPGTSTNNHYHPGWNVLMVLEGSYDVLSGELPLGQVILGEPYHLTGECAPGPDGVRELVFFNSIYGSAPFFLDTTDERSVTMLEQMPPSFSYYSGLTPPGPDPDSGVIRMERDQTGVVTPYFTAFTCQLGPDGFGARPHADDPSCYTILFEFQPGTMIPRHTRNGWSGLSVLKGDFSVSDTPCGTDVAVLFRPDTPAWFQVGPEGAQVMFYFDSGRAALPLFDDPSDAVAKAMLAVVHAG